MKFRYIALLSTTAAAVLAASQAALAFTATTTNNLHLRTGPGEQYPVITTIVSKDDVEVHGCLQGVTWCDVNWGDVRGWASAEYIAYKTDQGVELLPMAGDAIGIPTVTYTAVDAIEPEFVGTFETVDAEITAVSPPQQVSAYVTEQNVDTVYVKGEVVVGAVVPENVPLYAVPESEYSFTRVNGHNVLIDNSRQVVHIFNR